MQLTISAKQLGQKRALIANKVIEIDDIGPNPTIQRFIEAVVEQQVRLFNSRPTEANLLPFMDRESIDANARAGKIGFGSIYNDSKVDVESAKKTAIQAFEDGLFALFADGREFTRISDEISITPNTVITFIRLTFLAGGYW